MGGWDVEFIAVWVHMYVGYGACVLQACTATHLLLDETLGKKPVRWGWGRAGMVQA
jgi:hypothetical protein